MVFRIKESCDAIQGQHWLPWEQLLIVGEDVFSGKQSGCLIKAGRGCSGVGGASEAPVTVWNLEQDTWIQTILILSVIFSQLSCFVGEGASPAKLGIIELFSRDIDVAL